MKVLRRSFTEVLQCREYAPNHNGVGSHWKPFISKTYEFCSVDEFIHTFKPIKLSVGLKNSITTAYNDCTGVTFNTGTGNRLFVFNECS